MESSAIISQDQKYRYLLTRVWDRQQRQLMVCMLNPSVADANKNDATISRLLVRAKTQNYGGIHVVNLYAYRATDPRNLLKARNSGEDIIGKGNDQIIAETANSCHSCLVAWGGHALSKERCKPVADILMQSFLGLWAIGRTKDGSPKHPLHTRYEDRFIPYIGMFWLLKH